jgi:hypothetical protein
MTQTAGLRTEQPRTGLRFRLGLTILIVGCFSPLLIPIITRTLKGSD